MRSEPRPLALLTETVRTATAGNISTEALTAATDTARQALATATTPEAIKLIADKLDALARFLLRQCAYADQATGLLALKVDAERLLGQRLTALVPAGSHLRKLPPDVTAKESALWQKLATVPDQEYERIKERIRRRRVLLSATAVLREAGFRSVRRRTKPKGSSAAREEEDAAQNVVPLAEWQRGREPGEVTVGVNPPVPVVEFDEAFPVRIQTGGREGVIVALVVAPGPARSDHEDPMSSEDSREENAEQAPSCPADIEVHTRAQQPEEML